METERPSDAGRQIGAVRHDIAEAVGLLTRLPIHLRRAPRGARAAWAYPLAGLAVGGIAAAVAWLAGGVPQALSAGLALAAMVIVTGALHEDGLADSADGLWGGWTRDRRLEIMGDSRIGAYGVLALVIAVGLRWVALASVPQMWLALIGAAVLSRAPMAWVMWALPHARATGLSASTGRPGAREAWAATALATLIGALCFGLWMLWLVPVLVATTLAVALIARAKIGGQTGDILGATQQVSEIVILVGVVALAG